MEISSLGVQVFTFKEFIDFDIPIYDDRELYVLRNRKELLYIGISKDILSRWFFTPSSHCFVFPNGTFKGCSHVGYEIEKGLPESLNWNVDLWSVKNCLDFLKIKNVSSGDGYTYLIKNEYSGKMVVAKSRFVEEKFIQGLSPKYNKTMNNGSLNNELYEKYFSFI